MNLFKKNNIETYVSPGKIDIENYNNEKLIYEIIKNLILLISENLPSKITDSKEFEKIIFLAENLKNRL